MTRFEHRPPASPRRLPRARTTIAIALGAGLIATPALAANGRQIYVDMGCQVCHGEMGYGGVGPGFHDNAFLALPDYMAARVLLGGEAMPSFANRLSDDEIAAVVTYLRQRWHASSAAVTAKQVAATRKAVMQGPSADINAPNVESSP
jgi:mono/diheme cytochrome c family protein